ncbi:MAG: hypothetical protein KBT48_05235 [Firmicutes bacterium]|nr:hypothetical protein [Bacillota bacterium]
MEPEYKDKSIQLFIAIMKIAMGILGVFSFCYVISAVGLIDWKYYFPAPTPNPITMEKATYTKKEEPVHIEEEINEKFKEKEEIPEEESDGLYGHWDTYLKNYNDKIESYFNKGFYYEMYKESLKEKEEEKQKEEEKENNDYFLFDKKDKESDDSYYLDEYGWFLNPDAWKNQETGRYDFNDIFPWHFNF